MSPRVTISVSSEVFDRLMDLGSDLRLTAEELLSAAVGLYELDPPRRWRGDMLRAVRLARGVTQKELAAAMGVTPSRVGAIEHGWNHVLAGAPGSMVKRYFDAIQRATLGSSLGEQRRLRLQRRRREEKGICVPGVEAAIAAGDDKAGPLGFTVSWFRSPCMVSGCGCNGHPCSCHHAVGFHGAEATAVAAESDIEERFRALPETAPET